MEAVMLKILAIRLKIVALFQVEEYLSEIFCSMNSSHTETTNRLSRKTTIKLGNIKLLRR
jgi:hypothetical protein